VITEWLAGVFTGFISWLSTLVPSFTLPSWFTGFGASYNAFFASFNGFGVWANWTLIGSVLGVVLGFWLLVLVVKILRWLWGLTPFSGGD
jgi:hypothetical protein